MAQTRNEADKKVLALVKEAGELNMMKSGQ